MRQTLAVIFLVTISAATAADAGSEIGDYSGLPKDLAAAATAYDVAQYKSARSELQRWLADDYVVVGFDGVARAKSDAIAMAVDPSHQTTAVAISNQLRRYWKDGAVLAGVVDAKGTDHDQPFTLHAYFADVWAKRNGHWQVVFTQLTDLRTNRQ